jgi:hypothetical protein
MARQAPLLEARVSGLSGVLARCPAPKREERFADAELVGQEVELARLTRLLGPGGGLVTLEGPGGTRKTRLARQCAQAGEGRWPGGVAFCELSAASTLEGFAQAVAASLGAQPLSGDTAQWIADLGRAIGQRGSCLLVLDNFEQLGTEATDALAAGAQMAARATFLVTSRARLGLPDEAHPALARSPESVVDRDLHTGGEHLRGRDAEPLGRLEVGEGLDAQESAGADEGEQPDPARTDQRLGATGVH